MNVKLHIFCSQTPVTHRQMILRIACRTFYIRCAKVFSLICVGMCCEYNENTKGEQGKSCELRSDVSIGAGVCGAADNCTHRCIVCTKPELAPSTIFFSSMPKFCPIMTCTSIQHESQWQMIELINERKLYPWPHGSLHVEPGTQARVCRHHYGGWALASDNNCNWNNKIRATGGARWTRLAVSV